MTRTPRSIADRYVDAPCDLDRARAADPSLGPGSTDGDPVEPALRPAAAGADLPIPDDAEGVLAQHRGRPWTPELARAFLGENSGSDIAFLDSELVRYLGIPGQAISYKLGERAWLAGRAAAREARGADFDLKAWHMAALAQGSLGLDDLAAERARL